MGVEAFAWTSSRSGCPRLFRVGQCACRLPLSSAGYFQPLVPFIEACRRGGYEVLVALADTVRRAGYPFRVGTAPPVNELGAVLACAPTLSYDDAERAPWPATAGRARCWASATSRLETTGGPEQARVDAASRRSLLKGAATLRQLLAAAALPRVVHCDSEAGAKHPR